MKKKKKKPLKPQMTKNAHETSKLAKHPKTYKMTQKNIQLIKMTLEIYKLVKNYLKTSKKTTIPLKPLNDTI